MNRLRWFETRWRWYLLALWALLVLNGVRLAIRGMWP